MKKIPKILLLLLATGFWLLAVDGVFAQNQSVLKIKSGTGGAGTSKCSSTPTKCLKDDFNIVVSGNVHQSTLLDLHELLAEVSKSSKYKELLKSSGPTVVYFTTGDVNCSARVQPIGGGKSSITFYNFNASTCSKTTRKDRITHESGHVIRNGHMRLFQLYESQAYYPKDASCFYRDSNFSPSYFIKTYDTGFAKLKSVNISGSNESMADSMALYLMPQSPLNNFSSQCPKGYNWIKTNIFGNYVFN